jgi:hypothetical protein
MFQFQTNLTKVINEALDNKVPLDFLANKLAAGEFEMRLTILELQRERAAQSVAQSILQMNADGSMKAQPPGKRN